MRPTMLIVLRHLLESLAPPMLLLSSHINRRFRKAAADHVAVIYSGASHSYASAVRIGHFFSKASHHSLSGAFEHAKKICPRRKIGKKCLKYFLVGRMPAEKKDHTSDLQRGLALCVREDMGIHLQARRRAHCQRSDLSAQLLGTHVPRSL